MPDSFTTTALRSPRVRDAGLLLLFAGLAWFVYREGLHAPFLFDDFGAVRDNASIRHLWPLSYPLFPHTGGTGVDGRPIVNLTLALDYALGGLAVEGYRAFNLFAHVITAWLLFLLLRLALRSTGASATPPAVASAAAPLAFFTSLLWLLHPLQTESVLSAQNRSEILAAFFYLLVLHALARGATSAHPERWQLLGFLACLCGMATKEIMASAPLAALLFDRAFLAGSFAAAWRSRRHFYLALAATWLLLLALILAGHGRAGTVGFGLGVDSWHYLLTQCRAIVVYLGLAFWPAPLVFHYGISTAPGLAAVWPQALLVLTLATATIWALRRHPRVGFIGFVFFAVLAPSSSVIPIVTQTMAEHRMYLPLAAPLLLAVLALHAAARARVFVPLALAAPALAVVTVHRTHDYRSELALWTDTVAKAPDNPVAQSNLGSVLIDLPGRVSDALACFETALRLKPDFVEARYNYGVALLHLPGRLPDAIATFQAVLQQKPDSAEALNNLGNAYSLLPDRLDDAIACFETAIRVRPDFAEPHYNLGLALARRPDGLSRALACYQDALRLDPDHIMARNNLGNVLLRLGRTAEAIPVYEETLRRAPDYPEAHNNLGLALAATPGHLAEAIAHFRRAIRLNPAYAAAYCNLGLALLQSPGGRPAAREAFTTALRLDPSITLARDQLARLPATGD